MKTGSLREDFEGQLALAVAQRDSEIEKLVQENSRLTELLDQEKLNVHKLNCDVVTVETNLKTQSADYEQQIRALKSHQKTLEDEKE